MAYESDNNLYYLHAAHSKLNGGVTKYYPWWIYAAPQAYSVSGSDTITKIGNSRINGASRKLSAFTHGTDSTHRYLTTGYNLSTHTNFATVASNLPIYDSSSSSAAKLSHPQTTPDLNFRGNTGYMIPYSSLNDSFNVKSSFTTPYKKFLYGGTLSILMDRTDGHYKIYYVDGNEPYICVSFVPNHGSASSKILYVEKGIASSAFLELQGGGGGAGAQCYYSTWDGGAGGGGGGGGYIGFYISDLSYNTSSNQIVIYVGGGGSKGSSSGGSSGSATSLYAGGTQIGVAYGGGGGSRGGHNAPGYGGGGGSTYINTSSTAYSKLKFTTTMRCSGANGGKSGQEDDNSRGNYGGSLSIPDTGLYSSNNKASYLGTGGSYYPMNNNPICGGGGGASVLGGYNGTTTTHGYGYGGYGDDYHKSNEGTNHGINGGKGCAILHICPFISRLMLYEKTR